MAKFFIHGAVFIYEKYIFYLNLRVFVFFSRVRILVAENVRGH